MCRRLRRRHPRRTTKVQPGRCPCLQERNGGHLAMPLLGAIFQNTCSDLDLHNRQVLVRCNLSWPTIRTAASTFGRGVDRVTETGLLFDGVKYEVDCIIFATGFEVGWHRLHTHRETGNKIVELKNETDVFDAHGRGSRRRNCIFPQGCSRSLPAAAGRCNSRCRTVRLVL